MLLLLYLNISYLTLLLTQYLTIVIIILNTKSTLPIMYIKFRSQY